MKQWTKKQKIMLVAVFAIIVAAVGIVAGVVNYRVTQEGVKHFQVVVTSERDGYSETTECKAEEEYLGNFMRTFEGCEWQDSDYGIYITGFDGMEEDIDNQYWWCVMVNGESATIGADEIPLKDGEIYSFVLMQGW
ncbi:uncharacterized protein DUF4430 [Kineothrix alysoides]|uniref:Uncharacterized protein DUF4430 n=1 Tax=Kineothrix alysoides TaxID=1469948 RepID=A0A4R1QTF0_9FIRM|nr:DUF4430 domain-containing protein [Kineothrix alysoides]TCL57209.1 uncharacterized protein DUF4430 [Kineothrix alysoides]